MNGLLSLFLAGATLAGAVDDQVPKPKIDVSAQIYMPDGKASGASRRVELGSEPIVLYVYTGKTLCEARTVSAEKPLVAGNGWKVTLTPFKSVEIIGVKGAVPKGAVEVKATWQRLWEGGKELTSGDSKTRLLWLSPGNPVPLDTIDGTARLASRDRAAQWRAWKPADGIPAEFENDGQIVAHLNQITYWQRERLKLKAENGFGEAHPRIVAIDNNIASTRKQLNDRVQQLVNSAAAAETSAAVATSIDGCAALSMSLQIQAAAPASESPVFEIDYWLVHRNPARQETTQHQVVRTRSPNGTHFFFDDVKIETERGPVTVEIFGDSGSPWTNENGTTGLNVRVNRRYNTTSSGYGWKTKAGENSYGCTFARDEVLAFQLPPLPNDDGCLIGHRFSVRVRMHVLQ